MNLFALEAKNLLIKQIPEDWAEHISNYITRDSFLSIGKTVRNARYSRTVFPDSKHIFKAFKYPFEKVKVVIVGQDPYHNGNADGLAFSCKESLSPSLTQIIRAIWKDQLRDVNIPTAHINLNLYLGNRNNWNLEYLAEQGVFLYNPTLTVEQGVPNSHKGLWTDFTKAVFHSLDNKNNVVWMLWGKDAEESVLKAFNSIKRTSSPKDNDKKLLLTCEHPAAASYQKRIWECNHFSEANKFLESKGLTEIEWIQR